MSGDEEELMGQEFLQQDGNDAGRQRLIPSQSSRLPNNKSLKIEQKLRQKIEKLQPTGSGAGNWTRFWTKDEIFMLLNAFVAYYGVGRYASFSFLKAGEEGAKFYPTYNLLLNAKISTEITKLSTFGYNALVNAYFTYTNIQSLVYTLRYQRDALTKPANIIRLTTAFALSAFSSTPFAGLAVAAGLAVFPYVISAYSGYTALHYSGATALIDALSNLYARICCSSDCCQSDYDKMAEQLKQMVLNNIESQKAYIQENWQPYEAKQSPFDFIADKIAGAPQEVPANVSDNQTSNARCCDKTTAKKLTFSFTVFLLFGWGGPLSYLFSTKAAVDNLVGDESDELNWGLTGVAFTAFAALVARVLCVDIGYPLFDHVSEIWSQPTWSGSLSKFAQKVVGDEEQELKFDKKQFATILAKSVAALPSYFSAASAFYLFDKSPLSIINRTPVLPTLTIFNAMLFNGYPAPKVLDSMIESAKYYVCCQDTSNKQTTEDICGELKVDIQSMTSQEFIEHIEANPELLNNKQDELKQMYQDNCSQDASPSSSEIGVDEEQQEEDYQSSAVWVQAVVDQVKGKQQSSTVSSRRHEASSWGETLSRLFCCSRRHRSSDEGLQQDAGDIEMGYFADENDAYYQGPKPSAGFGYG